MVIKQVISFNLEMLCYLCCVFAFFCLCIFIFYDEIGKGELVYVPPVPTLSTPVFIESIYL